jgi:hypothetical protein
VPGSFVWLFGRRAHPALPHFLALQSWFLQPLHLLPPHYVKKDGQEQLYYPKPQASFGAKIDDLKK